MNWFYSPETGGFYIKELHADNMPPDSLEISKDLHTELFEQLVAGKRIVPGVGGFPCAVDQVLPTEELTADRERAWRDVQLLQYGGLRDRHRDEVELGMATTLTADQYAALLNLLQELREWPQSELFPNAEHRPVPPIWLTQLLS